MGKASAKVSSMGTVLIVSNSGPYIRQLIEIQEHYLICIENCQLARSTTVSQPFHGQTEDKRRQAQQRQGYKQPRRQDVARRVDRAELLARVYVNARRR